jgi:hypothetical protein
MAIVTVVINLDDNSLEWHCWCAKSRLSRTFLCGMSPLFVKLIRRFLNKAQKSLINLTKRVKDLSIKSVILHLNLWFGCHRMCIISTPLEILKVRVFALGKKWSGAYAELLRSCLRLLLAVLRWRHATDEGLQLALVEFWALKALSCQILQVESWLLVETPIPETHSYPVLVFSFKRKRLRPVCGICSFTRKSLKTVRQPFIDWDTAIFKPYYFLAWGNGLKDNKARSESFLSGARKLRWPS